MGWWFVFENQREFRMPRIGAGSGTEDLHVVVSSRPRRRLHLTRTAWRRCTPAGPGTD
jgi:hypothetical protein